MKKQLAEDIITFTEQIREKIISISSDDAYLNRILKEGTDKAHASANNTMKEIRSIIGLSEI